VSIPLNYFYRVDLVCVGYEGGAVVTKTFSFTNKEVRENTDAAVYWPILQTVGEVSIRAGEPLPERTISTIEIDNRIGSFGYQRKFGDILQRYSPVEQTITVYVAEVENDTDAVISWNVWATGVVVDHEQSVQGENPIIVFNIRPNLYSEAILNVEVARTVPGMENAPDSSLGRAVPILIGTELDVIPIRITADGATSVRYAVGTERGIQLENVMGGAAVYCRNELDEWEESLESTVSYAANARTGDYTLNTYAGRAFTVPGNPSMVCHGVLLRAIGKSSTPGRVSKARLSVYLIRYNNTTKQVIEEVARGTADLSIYDAQNNISADPIDLRLAFDRPAFLSAFEKYAIGWSVTDYAVNDLAITYTNTVTGDGFIRDSADANSSNGFEWRFTPAGAVPNLGIPRFNLLQYQSLFQQSSVNNQNGLRYTILNMTSQSVDSGQAVPPLDNFPLVVGNITGLSVPSGGATIDRPQSIADLLAYKWNGTAWVDSNAWDSTALNASHYEFLYNGATPTLRSRTARGVFENRITYTQLLTEVCRGTASRVGILDSGKSFMYPFGMTEAVAADIPAADVIAALSWTQGDISTVINRAVIRAGRSYLNAPRFFEDADVTGYEIVTDFSATNEPKVADMTAASRALYGAQDLENTDFLIAPNSTTGAYLCTNQAGKDGSILGEYFIARYGLPLVRCSFLVPYSRYKSLRLFQVVTFTSPNFPAYYGVEADARDGWVNTGSTVEVVDDADFGYETVRAQTYRGLIEGISKIGAMEHSPMIKLEVLVLLNYPHDPT
jgi:hypothetical protein